jgi:2-polyprenyl-3-methyl-5-hydroxy-6-metoxy-1,4-benzoquinol methylase
LGISPARSEQLPEYAIDPGREYAAGFARQALSTVASVVPIDPTRLDVLDVGSGYGYTTAELARSCRTAIGIEPSADLYHAATRLRDELALPNLSFRHQSVYELEDKSAYDLVVLDNVLEHLPDQNEALRRISDAMRPGAVLYILVPNKLWPIEPHYRLLFLGYLPISLANRYLRSMRRGTDYTAASYAPTYGSLRRMLAKRPELQFRFVLPADISLAQKGSSLLYRGGVRAIAAWPLLWWISKALLVVAVKKSDG